MSTVAAQAPGDRQQPQVQPCRCVNEIAVLKKVSMGHQNILTLVDYFETMNNLYLVTDLALGGELFDRICRKGSYYESDAADLIRAVLSAVAYLHDHGIVHRDLKPENLLFRTPEDNADLLIADFGLSRIMDEEQFHVLTTTCGTPGYMAPEIFKKTGHGKPVDLWALGAILNADYSFTPIEYWRGVSDSAKEFIRKCLTIDPGKRMTAHEALQHPFVAGWALVSAGGEGADKGTNLLPTVKKNFNARRTLHAAIDTVRAINKLREGQAGGFMNGVRSREPARGSPATNGNGNGNPAQAQPQGATTETTTATTSTWRDAPPVPAAAVDAPPPASSHCAPPAGVCGAALALRSGQRGE
ncbi:conserved hypothetical protein [Chaetomium globosum CBS 148.51]|uniref:Protein kinase domain-containing protein n=1 Tax=Chaetomium globosum (strain ATCC 6205 / CBS 148.51 / DSM 1962 / NBRC 6347 / NRRL 1970) TaxID=306901 RepID=Q2GQT3_CHAGB|nr:uncharacterized protein CHGG_09671 [Chaetomium globosum CBS 148.51]EAQ83267.1 conserved hypothetical protein [Chaetomium globosum CBS 148.51]